MFGFTARPFDSDTGLQNNLNRWYDAETGTWISVDPIGFAAADANLYRYVGNEVTMIVDPTGLAPPPSGFFGSWGASWTSTQNTYTSLILEHYYGLPHEAHDFMEQAYETGPLGQTKDSGPITKYGTRGALGVATAATTAAVAVGAVEVTVLGNESILVEGASVGGRMGSGGIFQIRPTGGKPAIRFDFHSIKPGGPKTPHIDSPPLDWHHWPWQ